VKDDYYGGPGLRPYGALAQASAEPDEVGDDYVVVESAKKPAQQQRKSVKTARLFSHRHYFPPYFVTEGYAYSFNSHTRFSPYVRVEQSQQKAANEDHETVVDDEVVVGQEDEDEEGGFPGSLPLHPGVITVPVKEGQPLAQALPSAFAVAGPFGLAQVRNSRRTGNPQQ